MSDKIRSLEFHIESQDYFGTLATILNLIKQDKNQNITKINKNILDKIEKDLMFLQRNYKITK